MMLSNRGLLPHDHGNGEGGEGTERQPEGALAGRFSVLRPRNGARVSSSPSSLFVLVVLIERDLRTLEVSLDPHLEDPVLPDPALRLRSPGEETYFLTWLHYFSFYSVGAVVSPVTSIDFIIGEDLFEEEELGFARLPAEPSLRPLALRPWQGPGRGGEGADLRDPHDDPRGVPRRIFLPRGRDRVSPGIFVLATGISGSFTLAMLIRNANRFDIMIALAEIVTAGSAPPSTPWPTCPRSYSQSPPSPVTSASDLVRAIFLPGYSADETVILILFVAIFFRRERVPLQEDRGWELRLGRQLSSSGTSESSSRTGSCS